MSSSETFARQLIIAIDENPASHAALAYCGNLFKNDTDAGFHLIHCTRSATQSVLSGPADAAHTLILDHNKSGKDQHLLDKGSKILEAAGISADRIRTSLIPATNQVCQSILMAADRTLADAVVVARRGIGYFGEMILGSVSASLFRSARSTPLWIIDGTVTDRDILIGVDGSVHSLRAVEHVAHMLKKRNDITVYLYHSTGFLAPEVVCTMDRFYEQWEQDWCDTHLTSGGCLFNGPAQLLKEAGVDPARIIVLPETKNLEESTSIIAQAKKHTCGTIVVGRRGPSVAKGFFGGVSNRTIRQTQDMAVWIVG